jgi:hypothetical protein
VERLRHITKDDLAEELSGQYQGDIVLTPEQMNEYRGGKQGKTGIRNNFYRWKDQTIPYWINETYFSKKEENLYAIIMNSLTFVYTCCRSKSD